MKSPYVIKFEHLGLGEHNFDFVADEKIFEGSGNEDIIKADFNIFLKLYKTGNMMNLDFNFEGIVTMPCDRCNDEMELNLEGDSKLVVKYGQSHHEDLDEMIVLEDHEHEFDLTQYIYESLSLLIPARHVHDEKDCNQEILKALHITEEKNSTENIDPRWEKLKNI